MRGERAAPQDRVFSCEGDRREGQDTVTSPGFSLGEGRDKPQED